MDFGSGRLYEIELWTSAGLRIADISHLCQDRSYTLTRNDAESFTFALDLFAFESYCQNQLGGADPNTLIKPYVTDVKVKRKGQYLFGAQVVDVSFNMTADSSSASESSGSTSFPVTVTCSGYLNLFKDRYLSKSYTSTERTSIATDLISTTQSQVNGSVGVTIAGAQYQTNALSDRTYQLDNVKSAVQNLAALTDAPFDFYFTWDKVFTTVAKAGGRRRDLSFIYGGPVNNVAGFSMRRSGSSLFNKIYGVGSGYGADQLTNSPGTGVDTVSQVNYYLREKIEQFNSVVVQSTLDQNTNTVLQQSKDLLELPTITIKGDDVPGAFLTPGDRIPLQVQSHPWLASVSGLYRIEEMTVDIDDNDFERSIQLTFDNYLVDQNE